AREGAGGRCDVPRRAPVVRGRQCPRGCAMVGSVRHRRGAVLAGDRAAPHAPGPRRQPALGTGGPTRLLLLYLPRARGPPRRALADSLLSALAARPGYSFYISAARETLGVRGWPGAAAIAKAGIGDEPALALATLLVEGGLGDDGAELAARWASGEA